MFLKGISPRHGSKWAPTIFHALDHLICLLTKEISEIATLCVILKSNLYIYIYTGIYTWLSRKHCISQIQSLIMMFFDHKLEHNSQLLDSVCCALYSKKPWFRCSHSGCPPIFWEMFSLWTDYPHLSLQGGTPPVINWLFACTAMKTSSIYHLNQHQSEIGLHKQTAI